MGLSSPGTTTTKPSTKSAGTTAAGWGEEKEGGKCIPYSHYTCRDSCLSYVDVERCHCTLNLVTNAQAVP